MLPRWILRLLGLLLLGAAGLKILAYAPSVPPPVPGMAGTWFTLAIVQGEILLGIWLLSGYARLGAWLVAILTFSVFAAVNLRSGWIGYTSCACFGAISVNPWKAFFLDWAVVALLAILARPAELTQPAALRDAARHALAFIGSVALILAAWTLTAVGTLGSTDAALAFLQGRRVFVGSAVVDFGTVPEEAPAEAVVEVHNLMAREVRLIGGTADCSCSFLADLPVAIPPGDRRTLRIRLRPPDGPGHFARVGWIWTDAPGHRSIPITLTGRRVRQAQ